MNITRGFLLRLAVAAALLTQCAAALAGTAALSKDGAKAYLLGPDDKLLEIDLESGAARSFSPTSVGAPEKIQFAATSNAGFLLGYAGRTVYACDLEKKKTVKLYTAPAKGDIQDLAYNPKDGAVAITVNVATATEKSGYQAFLIYVPKDPAEAGEVFCRRIDSIYGMAFDADGNFHFGNHGDLWTGRITKREDEKLPFVLTAERTAPVATLETSEATPSQTGIHEVAVGADGFTYLQVSRMGGSGWGNIVRIETQAIPSDDAEEKGPEVLRYAKRSMAALKSIKVLGENGREANLAATPDGTTVFFRVEEQNSAEGEQLFKVVRANGETRDLRVKIGK